MHIIFQVAYLFSHVAVSLSRIFSCPWLSKVCLASFITFKDFGLFERVWKGENPISQKTILTQIIIGKWPVNTNGYVKWRVEMEFDEKNSVKFEIYK